MENKVATHRINRERETFPFFAALLKRGIAMVGGCKDIGGYSS
jgi:hypothetical protein